MVDNMIHRTENCILSMKGFIELEVIDKNGKVKLRYKQPMRTWVKNFIKALRGIFYGGLQSQVESIIDVDGNDRPFPYLNTETSSLMQLRAGAGDDRFGILFGSGTTPVTKDDYTLESKIPNGIDAGQLSYGAVRP